MKDLLENDFIKHYNQHSELPVPQNKINIIFKSINDISFEIKDKTEKKDSDGNDIDAVAIYSNPNRFQINTINYEKFVQDLPQRMKIKEDGKRNDICDYIVYSENNKYFLLNELTDTNPKYIQEHTNTKGKQEGKLKKAQRQLLRSLELLNDVPSIHRYMQQFEMKQCCFFNSYTTPQPDVDNINAEQAFNSFDEIEALEPSKLLVSEIDALGFEFWVLSGKQTYLLEDKPTRIKAIADQLTKFSTKDINELIKILQ